MNSLTEMINCNLCKSDDYTLWAVKDGFNIVKCNRCNLIYVNPRLNAEKLKKAYDQDYFEMRTNKNNSLKRQQMYSIEIKDLEKIKKGGRILDVGCGGGFFLNSLSDFWEKYGVEISDTSAEFGRGNLGLNIKTGELTDAKFESDYFDVVNIRGVIEHLPDPMGDLRESYRILKKGGIVAINTPNIASLCAKIYKNKFRLIDPKRHIYYFSTRTISKILEEVGFCIIKKSYFYLGTPYAIWKDPFKILIDSIVFLFNRNANVTSPAFFGNVVNIYAEK